MLQVTCAIIKIENIVLVTQRSATMKLPFKWEFPGGKIENCESETACILREIKEEINIEITITQKLTPVIYDYGTFKINLIPFLAQYISGEITLAEHAAYKLLEKKELINLDWAAADLPIVEEFLRLKD